MLLNFNEIRISFVDLSQPKTTHLIYNIFADCHDAKAIGKISRTEITGRTISMVLTTVSPWLYIFTFHCVRMIEHSKLPLAVNRLETYMEKVLLLKLVLRAHERLPSQRPTHPLVWRDGNYFFFCQPNNFENAIRFVRSLSINHLVVKPMADARPSIIDGGTMNWSKVKSDQIIVNGFSVFLLPNCGMLV